MDTLPGIAQSVNRVLRCRGLATYPQERYADMVGRGVRKLIEQAAPGADVQQLVGDFFDDYRESWLAETQPYSGVLEMLRELCRNRMPLAILSNKPQVLVDMAVDRLLHETPFQAVMGQREGVPLKPFTGCADEVLHAIGAASSRIAMVGDTAVDIQTARNYGMTSVSVAWGFRPATELEDAGTDRLVRSCADLTSYLMGTA